MSRALLRRIGVAEPNLVAVMLTATTTPPMLLCSLYAQDVLGLAPLAAGLLFPPFNLAVVAGSLAGPRVAASLGERRAMVAGPLAVAAGALALLPIAPGATPLPSLLAGFLLIGAGLGVASVASTALGTAALDGADQGLASGMLATSAQVGTVLGLSVVVPLAAARAASLDGGPQAQVAGYELGFMLAAALAGAAAVAVALRARLAAPPTPSQGDGMGLDHSSRLIHSPRMCPDGSRVACSTGAAAIVAALLLGCGGAASHRPVESVHPAAGHAPPLVVLNRAVGTDPMVDTIELRSDGRVRVGRLRGGAGARFDRFRLGAAELRRLRRDLARLPDSTPPTSAHPNRWQYTVTYRRRTLTMISGQFPPGARRAIARLEALIDDSAERESCAGPR